VTYYCAAANFDKCESLYELHFQRFVDTFILHYTARDSEEFVALPISQPTTSLRGRPKLFCSLLISMSMSRCFTTRDEPPRKQKALFVGRRRLEIAAATTV